MRRTAGEAAGAMEGPGAPVAARSVSLARAPSSAPGRESTDGLGEPQAVIGGSRTRAATARNKKAPTGGRGCERIDTFLPSGGRRVQDSGKVSWLADHPTTGTFPAPSGASGLDDSSSSAIMTVTLCRPFSRREGSRRFSSSLTVAGPQRFRTAFPDRLTVGPASPEQRVQRTSRQAGRRHPREAASSRVRFRCQRTASQQRSSPGFYSSARIVSSMNRIRSGSHRTSAKGRDAGVLRRRWYLARVAIS
jgi:hypothetical protein